MNTRYGLSDTNTRLTERILPMGGSMRLPARGIRIHEMDINYPQRIHGIINGGYSPGRINKPLAIYPITTLLRHHARQGPEQVTKEIFGLVAPKGLVKPLPPRGSKIYKAKTDTTSLVEKSLEDPLIGNMMTVLVPRLVTPLLIGYYIWDNTVISEIYRGLYKLCLIIRNMNDIDPTIKEEITQCMGELSSSGCEATKAVIQTSKNAWDEIEDKAAETIPEEKTPKKIAVWIAGILLAAAIFSIKNGGIHNV